MAQRAVLHTIYKHEQKWVVRLSGMRWLLWHRTVYTLSQCVWEARTQQRAALYTKGIFYFYITCLHVTFTVDGANVAVQIFLHSYLGL